MEAAMHDDIAAISIATRPDCIDESIMKLIIEIHQIKPVFIEFGLQTSNETTAAYIRRGYKNSVFADAIKLIDSYNSTIVDPLEHIHIVVHAIIGLPGESYDDMEQTINYINSYPIHGIKLQLLHVLRDTDLEKEYKMPNQYMPYTWEGCVVKISDKISYISWEQCVKNVFTYISES